MDDRRSRILFEHLRRARPILPHERIGRNQSLTDATIKLAHYPPFAPPRSFAKIKVARKSLPKMLPFMWAWDDKTTGTSPPCPRGSGSGSAMPPHSVAHPEIKRIVQVLLVIRSGVEIHRHQVLRRHPGACRVQLQFADRDAGAVGAEIAQTENAPAGLSGRRASACRAGLSCVHDSLEARTQQERRRGLLRSCGIGLSWDRNAEVLNFEHRGSTLAWRPVGCHPTLPSRLIVMSFCASTANSIGNCCNTSRTKPLTMSAVASSADRPRCKQ